MKTALHHKLDDYRRLFIKKDLIELSSWITTVERINDELQHLKLIESQLIKNSAFRNILIGFRRKNTLVMGLLCKYEQALKKELEFGNQEYNVTRAKEHEKYRERYVNLITEFRHLKNIAYHNLAKYRRR